MDENLEKKKTQPKFVKSGAVNAVDKNIITAYGGNFFQMEVFFQVFTYFIFKL